MFRIRSSSVELSTPNHYRLSTVSIIAVLFYHSGLVSAFLLPWLVIRSQHSTSDNQVMQVLLTTVGFVHKTLIRQKPQLSIFNSLTSYLSYAYLILRKWDHNWLVNRLPIIPYYSRSIGNRIYVFYYLSVCMIKSWIRGNRTQTKFCCWIYHLQMRT